MLTSARNKSQLIQLIIEDITENCDEIGPHKLVLTGPDSVPIELNLGLSIRRCDMENHHEEADVIIIHHQVASVAADVSFVFADDTDVFVLLCHHLENTNLKGQIYLSSLKTHEIININATVSKHDTVVENLLAGYGLFGCDTVASYFGLGEAKLLNCLKKGGHSLSLIGDVDADVNNAIAVANKFILQCYGRSDCNTLNEARFKIWVDKLAKCNTSPKL